MDRRCIHTGAMYQARLVCVVSDVGQDLVDRARPPLHYLHVEGEESLQAVLVKASPHDRRENRRTPKGSSSNPLTLFARLNGS
jgi:hypothetical protein